MRGDEIDDVEKSKSRSVRGLDRYGLCSTCYHCFFSRSEFKIKVAICTALEQSGVIIKLDSREPVTECNNYGKKTMGLSLEDMYRMATIIDAPKTRAGFVQEDN